MPRFSFMSPIFLVRQQQSRFKLAPSGHLWTWIRVMCQWPIKKTSQNLVKVYDSFEADLELRHDQLVELDAEEGRLDKFHQTQALLSGTVFCYNWGLVARVSDAISCGQGCGSNIPFKKLSTAQTCWVGLCWPSARTEVQKLAPRSETIVTQTKTVSHLKE